MFSPRTSLSPILGCQARVFCDGKRSPHNVCGLLWRETEGQGDRDSTLKGCTQNLTHSWTQGKNNNLKGVWVTTPADFGESPGKVRGNGAYHQQTDTGGGHFQDLVLPLDTGAGKNHFGNLQAYQRWYLV